MTEDVVFKVSWNDRINDRIKASWNARSSGVTSWQDRWQDGWKSSWQAHNSRTITLQSNKRTVYISLVAQDSITFVSYSCACHSSDRQVERLFNIRNYIVHPVDALQPLRDGQHHNSFFKLDGDEALDYDTVVEYIISDLAEAEPISLNTCTIVNEDDVDVASDDDNDGAALNESTDELTDKQKQEARKRKKSI